MESSRRASTSEYHPPPDMSIEELGTWLEAHGDEQCPHRDSKKINVAGALALTGQKKFCQVCTFMAGKQQYYVELMKKAGMI